MKRVWMTVMPVVLLGLLGGCATLYRSPVIELADVRVVGVGLTTGTAEVHLRVENPNWFGLEVRQFRYRLEVAQAGGLWTPLATGSSSERIRVGGRSRGEVILIVPFQYRALGNALMAYLAVGEIVYRIEGDVQARGASRNIDVPFRSQGAVTP